LDPRPPELPRDHRDRQPVIRNERVQNPDGNDGADEQELWSGRHLK
jgi:hypothetical protein